MSGAHMQVRKQLAAVDVGATAATKILEVMACRSIDELQAALGPSEAVAELQLLFQLAEGYGYGEWLEYDASVVRGLAYYTGAPPPPPRRALAASTPLCPVAASPPPAPLSGQHVVAVIL